VAFFNDLCTPKELKEMQERWQIAQLLNRKKYSYRDIKSITNSSLTTITRVAKFLVQEKNSGYRIILDRKQSNANEN
jgi:TrpR-related protein YerC/YecD